jgi:signal transduction histidine kinase/CheY-like chemotaxis protein
MFEEDVPDVLERRERRGPDTSEHFERRFRRKDGNVLWVHASVTPMTDEKGRFLGSFAMYTDITERKQSEQEKLRLESQLFQSQKMEAIGTLAGGIAHDFNNILTALMGYGTLLQMGLDNDSPLRTYVDQMLSSSVKAAQLTQSLLAFSRQQPITLKPVKLNNIIKTTEKLLKRLLTEDITLKTNLTIDDTTIMGDATQIDQILFNLATNARDAMPKGGMLAIETKRVRVDREFKDFHGYGEPGMYTLISISDTGIGMDEATKEHIFDPFFTTKDVGKGTGLGLSTVYGIVKQHNGYIIVDSRLNAGTTFHVYLPAVTGAIEEEKPVASELKGGEETILVAEDSEAVRVLMRTILTKYGYTVIEAIDGEDAIDKFDKHRNVDLLIVDSVMPKKNGREVYDEITKAHPHVKILFTSGYTRDVVLDKGIEEKEFDFISKPLSPDNLLRKVRAVLDN